MKKENERTEIAVRVNKKDIEKTKEGGWKRKQSRDEKKDE